MVKIGLDFGHGNNTFPPSKGVYKNGKGYAEHDFNSKLGVAIQKLLEGHGHTVILGQSPFSKEVGLTTRTNLYNRKNVDIVVSIHANANTNSGVNGRCVFYWHTSSNGKKLAQSIINEIKAKGYSTHGNGLHESKRGSWTNLHITRETKAPAVLIEHGFMTGNKDFDLIFGDKQDEYIKDMAEADVKGILNYLGQDFKGGKTISAKPVKSSVESKKPASSGKSVAQMADEVLASGKTGNKNRANYLGLSLSEYEPVRQEINSRYGGKTTSAPKSKPAPKKKTNKYPLPNGIFKVQSPMRQGNSVRQIQNALASVYFYPDKGAKNNGIDGWYGPKTADAVRRFQLVHGLTADGIYGPNTRKKLDQLVN